MNGMKRIYILFLLCATFSSLRAGEDPLSEWKPFALERVKLAGLTVLYAPEFKDELEGAKQVFKVFLENQRKSQSHMEKLTVSRDSLLQRVNQWIGGNVTELRLNQQRKEYDLITDVISKSLLFKDPDRAPAIVLVDRLKLKNFVRNGGKLNHITYNKQTDEASLSFEFKMGDKASLSFEFNTGDKASVRFEFKKGDKKKKSGSEISFASLPILVSGKGDVARACRETMGKLLVWEHISAGGLLHELVESELFNRLRMTDPYARWYTDGMANVMTHLLLEEFVDAEVAAAFSSRFDVKRYPGMEKEVRLTHWPSAGFDFPAVTKSESHLSHARYAYATAEASRLYESHGVKVITKVLDNMAAKEGDRIGDRSGAALLAALQEVTGEDVAAHLNRFEMEKDPTKQAKAFYHLSRKAETTGKMEEALYCWARFMESLPAPQPASFAQAAILLHRHGHGLEANAMLQEQMQQPDPKYRAEIVDAWIAYSLVTKQFELARDSAQELLTRKPNHVPAMSLLMAEAAKKSDFKAAGMYAQRILDAEADPNSTYASNAQKMIEAIAKHKK